MKSYKVKILLVFLFLAAGTARAVDEHVWLHVEGKYIRKSLLCDDPNGIWMGAGVAHRYNSTNENVTNTMQAKANWASANHANVTRISMNNISDWISSTNLINNFLSPLVAMYKAKKIYVVIDSHYYMHNSNNYSNGTFWDVNSPSTYCTRWLNDWVAIANYFKDEPWVLGYELCNEPIVYTSNPAYNGTVAKCRNNYKECIRRIRQVDTKHIIFLGNGNWSHAASIREYYEDGLPDSEKYNPDPGYGQVVYAFHEYTESMKLYASAGGYVNEELGRIQNTFNVPLMCTEFGHDDVVFGLGDAKKRQFEQEMIEMCYGQPNFWRNAPISDKAYPSRGTPAAGHISWIMWRMAGYSSTDFSNNSRWTDIWTYAANIQGSSAPVPISDPTPPSAPFAVRDGSVTGLDVDTTTLTTQLSANWDVSVDTNSGIDCYWYAIGTSAGATNTAAWTDNGNVTLVTRTGLSLTAGQRYYFSVKAENGVKLLSTATNSNGQLCPAGATKTSTPQILVKAYPNPCDIRKNSKMTLEMIQTGSSIPSPFSVSVYSLDGSLIRELRPSGAKAEWNGKNESGEAVPAGIYIFSFKNTDGTVKSGKIALIK
ncbi:MAG: hypothetical protein A2297_01575 [Elusimicrobia bacterium RIFOXYB2_FULL_48_7]|nr:MAG: hypothetical protein A2297_01575 [Elusimicrobia bacterium RIFOXYB2_FULL_48_7]